MDLFSKQHLQSTTQQYLEINDITNDLLILNDGAVAMVLVVGTLNFGLLSEEEQDAIIYSYAGLLNSLSFNIQIVIRSQRKDVSAYIQYIQDNEQQTISPLRKTQIRKYKEFVSGLVKDRNVLDKKFYVVIPYTGAAVGANSPIPKIKKNETPVLDKPYILEKAMNDLEPKKDHLISQFSRIGLGSRQLATQELIQLMHGVFNPNTSEGQRMTDTSSYASATVTAENYQLYQPTQEEQQVANQHVADQQGVAQQNSELSMPDQQAPEQPTPEQPTSDQPIVEPPQPTQEPPAVEQAPPEKPVMGAPPPFVVQPPVIQPPTQQQEPQQEAPPVSIPNPWPSTSPPTQATDNQQL